MKALGLNAITTYVPWDLHEPAPGVYNWEADADLDAFLGAAQAAGFLVLLRPGPYICAEWAGGGLPAWLANPATVGTPLPRLRSDDPAFLTRVDAWWDVLLPRIARWTVARGGPIAAVQVENELGFVGPEKAYMKHLAARAAVLLPGVVLFTVDPPAKLKGGALKGLSTLTTVDFGPNTNLAQAFGAADAYNPPGRRVKMCTEWYTGWLTRWGEPAQNTSLPDMVSSLTSLLAHAGGTASVSLYMGAGGTNFGWSAGGAADDVGGSYVGCVTSYDYTSPVGESGVSGQPGMGGGNRYTALRGVIAGHTRAALPPPPTEPVLAAYGRIPLTQAAPLLDALPELAPGDGIPSDGGPRWMQAYGQAGGLIVYSVPVPTAALTTGPAVLTLACPPHDAARILIGGHLAATLARGGTGGAAACAPVPHSPATEATLNPKAVAAALSAAAADGDDAVALTFIVEAVGRDNGGANHDLKGLPCRRAWLNGARLAAGWRAWPLPLSSGDVGRLNVSGAGARAAARGAAVDPASTGPAIYRGFLTVPVGPDGGWLDASEGREGAEDGRPLVTVASADAALPRPPPPPLRRHHRGPHPADTYLSMVGWSKGVVFVNGFHLGWYWPAAGPGATLYVPGPILRAGENEVIVLEVAAGPRVAAWGEGPAVASVATPTYGPPPGAPRSWRKCSDRTDSQKRRPAAMQGADDGRRAGGRVVGAAAEPARWP